MLLVITSSVSFFPVLVLDALSPAVVSVSDSGPGHIRVSWGPLQPARVQKYTVEYGAIPSGHVQTVALHSQKNSIVLTGLEPGTQYLVTISALHMNGDKRAMSVRACTQEGMLSVCVHKLVCVFCWCYCFQIIQLSLLKSITFLVFTSLLWKLTFRHSSLWITWPSCVKFSLVFFLCSLPAAAPPALVDLKLTPMEQQELQVAWLANQEGLKGYWLSYERKKSRKSSSKPSVSSIYLPPTCHSIWLTHLTQSSQVCVSPIYSSGRGEGLCCTAPHDTR